MPLSEEEVSNSQQTIIRQRQSYATPYFNTAWLTLTTAFSYDFFENILTYRKGKWDFGAWSEIA